MFNERVHEYVQLFSSMSFDEGKQMFWELAKKFHPDVNQNADSEIFKAISSAWDEVKRALADKHAADNGNSSNFSTWANAMFDALMSTAIELSKISPSLIVTITGYWIWVEGNTKDHKDEIKKVVLKVPNKFGGIYSYGAKFSPKKQAWYFAGVKSSGKGNMTLDQIKSSYGNVTVNHSDQGISV